MTAAINQDHYGSVPKPLGEMPDAYIMEVTSEETGRKQKIVSMKVVESEKMTRCVSGVGCDKNDRPIEKYINYKFPWDIEKVAAEFDGGGKVSFQYVTTPRYGVTHSDLPNWPNSKSGSFCCKDFSSMISFGTNN
jgi:hypothetical protein